MLQIPVLSPEEARAVRDRVHALRIHWTQRLPWLPFYTLGAAIYLDMPAGSRQYRALAERVNPVLASEFGWLHERVAAILSEQLDGPVSLDPRIGLPGFHVFLAHPAFGDPLASVHLDLQYQQIDWGAMGYEKVEEPRSFTLAIALPRNGGGLCTWPLSRTEFEALPMDRVGELVEAHARQFWSYTVGHMAIHHGHQVHMIAPCPNMQGDDERITLQGHAVRCDGTWVLYW
jgi:hypothetical protein